MYRSKSINSISQMHCVSGCYKVHVNPPPIDSVINPPAMVEVLQPTKLVEKILLS